jgi:hypothetical protein
MINFNHFFIQPAPGVLKHEKTMRRSLGRDWMVLLLVVMQGQDLRGADDFR